jgi:phytoene dehydrogenase-like protein
MDTILTGVVLCPSQAPLPWHGTWAGPRSGGTAYVTLHHHNGTWAGPRSGGTAYVTLHHHIGGVDGQAGAWGFPRRGMGAVTTALAAAARSFGAEIRTGAEVARIRTRGGQVTGVTLASGEDVDAGIVVTTAARWRHRLTAAGPRGRGLRRG